MAETATKIGYGIIILALIVIGSIIGVGLWGFIEIIKWLTSLSF